MRYLYFDHDGKTDYQQVEIPNCVMAVYFGLKCPEEERAFIMKLLEGRTWTNRYQRVVNGRLKDFEKHSPIEFTR